MTAHRTRFGDLEVAYDDEILGPRDWTIEQSRWAIDLLDGLPDGPVLELCAGAGHIGLVVAVGTGRPLVQVDDNERACAFARRNAKANTAVSDVRHASIEEALSREERFHLVLADPPYVPTEQVHDFPDDPDDAIDGGGDGLEVARTCLRVTSAHLLEGGLVLIQLGGPAQAASLSEDAGSHGLTPVETRDYGDDGALLLLRGAESRGGGSR